VGDSKREDPGGGGAPERAKREETERRLYPIVTWEGVGFAKYLSCGGGKGKERGGEK